MSLKMISHRIDEEMIKEVKNICNYLGVNQADFLSEAIRNEIERTYLEQCGGIAVNIPNPRIFTGIKNSETVYDIIDAFDDLDRKLRRMDLDFRNFIGTKELSEFIESRLLDDPETVKKFQDNIEYLQGKPKASSDWISDSEA